MIEQMQGTWKHLQKLSTLPRNAAARFRCIDGSQNKVFGKLAGTLSLGRADHNGWTLVGIDANLSLFYFAVQASPDHCRAITGKTWADNNQLQMQHAWKTAFNDNAYCTGYIPCSFYQALMEIMRPMRCNFRKSAKFGIGPEKLVYSGGTYRHLVQRTVEARRGAVQCFRSSYRAWKRAQPGDLATKFWAQRWVAREAWQAPHRNII